MCPVVTACVVFKDSHGDNFIGIIHHGVYNKNSATTLLSEFQLRENSLIVDSVSCKHQVSETEYGQQCISILTPEEHEGNSIPGPTIPLWIKHALMTIKHHLPTQVDLDSFPYFHLTGKEPWDPSRFYENDDDYSTVELLLTNQVLA